MSPSTPACQGGRSSGPLPGRTGLATAVSLAALLAGCAVPQHMRIENAYHPKYEDEDVRFRATYYFRVFDYCGNSSAAKEQPRSDTLYRFRMTGKAKSITNQIRFESGTLTAGQIDPFGANVVYDERNKQFIFKSQGEAQQESARERKFADLERLLGIYGGMQDKAKKAEAGQKDAEAALLGEFRNVIQQRVLSLRDPESQPDPKAKGTADEKDGAGASAKKDTQPGRECFQFKRGFQILGPEGWRTFNQDERLLLAMFSSGKPVISTMQELSGRVLNNQPIEAELLLPLVQEDLRISLAERELEKFTGTNPERGLNLLDNAIKSLGGKGVGQ